MINTRPFDVPVATAVDFVGLIYLLILAVRPCSPSIKMFKFTEGVIVRRNDGTLRCTCGSHASSRSTQIQVPHLDPHHQPDNHLFFRLSMFNILLVASAPLNATDSASIAY